MASPRPMAMAQPAFAPVDAEAVKVGWSAEMRFPRTIKIPVWVSNGVWGRGNGRREITIRDANEPLHPLLVTFLNMMPAYRSWLAPTPQPVAQPDVKLVEQTPVEVVTVMIPADPAMIAEDEPQSDVQPPRRRRKKSNDRPAAAVQLGE